MAVVKVLKNPEVITHAYLVSAPVGAGRPNRRDDVLLIQFFLAALAPLNDPATQESFQPPGAPPLAIDGFWGHNSQRYLDHYLAVFNRGSAKVSDKGVWSDSAVDPVLPGQFVGTIHGRTMVMISLNAAFRAILGTPAHAQLHTNPLFPRELADQFYF